METILPVFHVSITHTTKVRRDGPQKELTLVTLGHGLMIM